MSYSRRFLSVLSSALMFVGLSGLSLPSEAAEKITINYGAFGRSIAISDLRQYLETGKPPSDLASILSVVSQQERESLLAGLKFKVPLNVVVMDKLLRSPQGEQLLTQVAGTTSLPGGEEKLALRSALIVAASSKDGVGLLSFLEAYPSQTLRIDIPAVQKLLKSSDMLGGFMGGQFPGGDSAPGATDTPAESQDPPGAAPDSETAPESEPESLSPDSAGEDATTPSKPSPDASDVPATDSEDTPLTTPEKNTPIEDSENANPQ